MSLTIVGSVALDTVKSPFGEVEMAEGGSATYASLSASYFTTPHVVGIVGEDTYDQFVELFKKRKIVTDALIRAEGKTFHWQGEYGDDMNEAITHSTCLNVFADFNPELPDSYKGNEVVFLGNIAPELQLSVLKQCEDASVKAADTMNFWITSCPEKVWEVIPKVDILFINHAETLMLTGERNIHVAADKIMSKGLPYLVVKKGEFGVSLYGERKIFCAPAMPLKQVKDPTGAGDSFAGGFLGYLCNNMPLSFDKLKQACLYGTAMASINIEEFSIKNLLDADKVEIERRCERLRKMCTIGEA